MPSKEPAAPGGAGIRQESPASPVGPGGNERGTPPATSSQVVENARNAQAAKEALDKWFEENCRDSDISRDTEVYNAVHMHVHAIKALLNGLSAKPKE